MGPLNLSRKRLVLFMVNDNADLERAESGTHWSLLVYYRSTNSFAHHDSIEGVNNSYAMKLYDAVKGFMGSSESSSTKLSKVGNKKKKDKEAAIKPATVSTKPCFLECKTPQQSNGYGS